MHNEQIFTPYWVVNMMLNKIGYIPSADIHDKHIIDNSCGDGAFLAEIVDRYIKHGILDRNISKNELKKGLEKYIHGIDKSGNRTTSKGYISKNINGVLTELNPNGNISSCKEIIHTEFSLDLNFMALSQLSTESRGMAYMIPSSRKKFVTNIINELEVYNLKINIVYFISQFRFIKCYINIIFV